MGDLFAQYWCIDFGLLQGTFELFQGRKATFGVTFRLFRGRPRKSLSSHFLVTFELLLFFWGGLGVLGGQQLHKLHDVIIRR